jgi:hypothetical protein
MRMLSCAGVGVVSLVHGKHCTNTTMLVAGVAPPSQAVGAIHAVEPERAGPSGLPRQVCMGGFSCTGAAVLSREGSSALAGM